MAEPAPKRRSSRSQTADSATSVNLEETSPAAPADVPAAALSRRALRDRQRRAAETVIPEADAAPGDIEIVSDSVVADMATTVVAATEIIVEAVAEPAETQRVTRRSSRVAVMPADEGIAEQPAESQPVAEAASDAPASTAPASTESADDAADAFDAASRAFSFVPAAPSVPGVDKASTVRQLPKAAVHVPARRRRARGKFVAAGATVGVMGIAGLIAVSMTLPAEAVAVAQGESAQTSMSLVAASKESSSSVSDEEIQAYVASSDVQNDEIQRAEGFSAASLIDLATQQGISYSGDVFTNDPEAAIQWPFIVGVSMSYGYGMRDGRLHEGLDLLPGAGAPVQAIADGKVRTATESGGNYGVTVYIDHMVDGKLITSHYSHMQYGSLEVQTGDTVKVGDIVGKVGDTGRSYGAHMHFELIVDGSTIDPLPWLNENAGRNDGVSPVS
ncbi:M23 family metallopeptidase [Microbacterium sp.]|uniref:M23 family metallopeptidase n=1 Tax=Microbacterium sp. TaxID=51671 RepID=UPI003F955312